MTHYEKACRHHSNHMKDRFYQQCSGYCGKSLKELREEEKRQRENVKETFIISHIKEAETGITWDEIAESSETWEGIIEKGKNIKNKKDFFIFSTKFGLMGRLDLNY